jgi:hypothetical protein
MTNVFYKKLIIEQFPADGVTPLHSKQLLRKRVQSYFFFSVKESTTLFYVKNISNTNTNDSQQA